MTLLEQIEEKLKLQLNFHISDINKIYINGCDSYYVKILNTCLAFYFPNIVEYFDEDGNLLPEDERPEEETVTADDFVEWILDSSTLFIQDDSDMTITLSTLNKIINSFNTNLIYYDGCDNRKDFENMLMEKGLLEK